MIKIEINKELDKEVYRDFWDFSVAGADFGGKIKKEHPEINLNNHQEYIDEYYEKNLEQINQKQKHLKSKISEKEKDFIISIENNLKIKVSDLDYVGYLSIFDCNPRFIENNTFQVFYKRNINNMLEVVFHESLHFIFFDFCDRELDLETKNMDKNSGPLWELSEIFNVIVLNLPDFQKILEQEELLFYPDLKVKLKDINNIWNKKIELKDFIIESIKYLENKE